MASALVVFKFAAGESVNPDNVQLFVYKSSDPISHTN